ncbi:MAG: hypothetical protein LLF93_06070 [Bacteroidales bacterium]|nr:hypothetical protein [Bacteroidales bacterium]
MKINKRNPKTILIVVVISATLLISCGGPGNNSSKSVGNSDSTKIVLNEELPPLQTTSINVGKLRMHQDGYSIGKKTELTELQNQLINNEFDIIEIVWIWDSSPKYADMPMKIIYNKIDGTLKLIYTTNNVIEEYSNISPECLSKFFKNGEKSLYKLQDYCKNSKYDFNNREMTTNAIGDKPEQSEWDGSVKVVKDFIKENANDASSIKFLEWSKVSAFDKFWIVRCKYKGTNALGGVITENVWFYIQNNQVIKTKKLAGE